MSATETEKGTEAAAQAAPAPVPVTSNYKQCTVADVVLRLLLLAASVAAVVVMVTSKETVNVPAPNLPGVTGPLPAKFNHYPAFIYFVAALSVAGLYSIITGIVSLSYIKKPYVPAKLFLVFVALDVLALGIVAAAVGSAGGIAYIGLKGNTHVRWGKICNVYGKFCRHIGSSIAVSLFASIMLVLLVILNSFLLFSRIPSSSRGSSNF